MAKLEVLSLNKFHALNSEDIRRAADLIDTASTILITAHKSPDGDAVGSTLALWHYLQGRHKNAVVLLPDRFAEFLRWMPGVESIVYFDQDAAVASNLINNADLIFCLDYNVLSRTGKEMSEVLETKRGATPFILIDHHQHPADFPEVLLSDTSACSTAQLVYRFVDELGDIDQLTSDMGACLYCGIMTDSGSFRFPSVTAETHRIAAHLMEVGVDHADIHRRVYDTNLLDRLRLVGYALSEKLVVLPEFHAAYITLNREELRRFNYRPGDTEGLVNQALSIEGVNMAVFIREGNNEVKLSFRSQGKFKVNELANVLFQGGGHNNAAGAAVDLPIEEVVHRIVSILPRYKQEIRESI